MRIDRYPLEHETPEGLLDRLQEECAEVIKACSKIKRFGINNHHPDRPASMNSIELAQELADVRQIAEHLARRGLVAWPL